MTEQSITQPKILCPKCQSDNISIQAIPIFGTKNRSFFWWIYFILIGWVVELLMWFFLTIPMFLIRISHRKGIKTTVRSMGICQNCGNVWEIKDGKEGKKFEIRNKKIIILSTLLLILICVLGAIFTPKSKPLPTPDIKAIGTQIAGTMIAGMVQTQQANLSPTIMQAPTNTPVQDLGFTIKVIGMDNPAKPGMFYTPKSGQKLIVLEVIAENVNLVSLSVNPLYFQVVDSEGFVYENDLFGIDSQITSTAIAKGEKVRGQIGFTMPESSKPAKLKFTMDWLSNMVLTIDLP
jgi:hypothetical protein